MRLKSGIFQSNPFAALLRGAAFAMTLVALALPAHAEVVTLVCQTESGGSFTLRIDYDRNTVADVHSDGSSGAFVPAKITEGDVTWDHVFPNVEVFKGNWGRFGFAGSLNRLSGQGQITYWRMDTNQGPLRSFGQCRRATQKF